MSAQPGVVRAAYGTLFGLAAVRAVDAAVLLFTRLGGGDPELAERAGHHAEIALMVAGVCAILALVNLLGLHAGRVATWVVGGFAFTTFLAAVFVVSTQDPTDPKTNAKVIRNGTILPDAYLWAMTLVTLAGLAVVMVLLAHPAAHSHFRRRP